MMMFFNKNYKLVREALGSLKKAPVVILYAGLVVSCAVLMFSAYLMYVAQQDIMGNYMLSQHAIAGVRVSLQILTQSVAGALVLQYLIRD